MRHKSWAHKQKRGAWGRELYQASDEKGDSWERCTSSGTKVRVPRLHGPTETEGAESETEARKIPQDSVTVGTESRGEARGKNAEMWLNFVCLDPEHDDNPNGKTKGKAEPFC